jgi:serine/threonine protein kinase
MSGGSVYDWIRREGPLKLSTVLKVCVEVSRGMDYLHQRNIIHRDLKAANLLLDENGTVSRRAHVHFDGVALLA